MLFLLSAVVAQATVIKRETLDENKPMPVLCHPEVSTTLSFPYPVQGVDGNGFIPLSLASPDETILGDWDFTHSKGTRFITLRPCLLSTVQRNLNVVVNGKVYVFEARVESNKADAYSKLQLELPAESTGTAPERRAARQEENSGAPDTMAGLSRMDGATHSGERIKRRTSPPKPSKPVTAEQILGFLDKAKIVAVAKEADLAELSRKAKVTVSVRRDDVSEYGMFRIIVERVVRDDSMDAIGFIARIENNSSVDLLADAESGFVRSGQFVYRQKTADIPPVIPAGQSRPLFLVIQGDGEGGRNRLAVENRFTLGLSLHSKPKAEQLKKEEVSNGR